MPDLTLAPSRLIVADRRHARRLAYENAAYWAVGNGLTSSTLIVYLAVELGASRVGLGISLILAAPRIAGLTRLCTPALIAWFGDRKRFCLTLYLASAIVLAVVPLATLGGWLPRGNTALALVVALWCVYHLLEFLATVGLYAWLADLVPLAIRGRFFGRRERWMLVGQATAMLAAGLFSYYFPRGLPQAPRLLAYAIPAWLGAVCMAIALVPLAGMPPVEKGRLGRRMTTISHAKGGRLSDVVAPFRDRRFLPLVWFGCWFSFFNGVTQSAQNVYPARVLGLSLLAMLTLQTAMRVGQVVVSPWLGRVADRWGNRRLMLATLPWVATGPLFYALSTPQQPWWLAGAWLVWIAYAGINIGLPSLMLKLAPSESKTAYVAAFHALSGLCVAVSTIVGGYVLDRFVDLRLPIPGTLGSLNIFQIIFLVGAVTRVIGMLWLLAIEERKRPLPTPPLTSPE